MGSTLLNDEFEFRKYSCAIEIRGCTHDFLATLYCVDQRIMRKRRKRKRRGSRKWRSSKWRRGGRRRNRTNLEDNPRFGRSLMHNSVEAIHSTLRQKPLRSHNVFGRHFKSAKTICCILEYSRQLELANIQFLLGFA
jgi:hypothetical protein